jgi:glycerophosphoryl diester phosphodiesterase
LAFAQRRQLHVLLDLKDPQPDIAKIVRAIREHGLAPNTTIGIHSTQTLHAVQQQAPLITTLAFAEKDHLIDDYLSQGADIIRLWARWVLRKPQLVATIHGAGACAWVTTGTLPARQRMERIMRLGVGGLITDYPREVLHLRARLNRSP